MKSLTKPANGIFICLFLFSSIVIFSQEATIRVVDVGAGLCNIIKLPDNQYIIYDAGNYQDGGKTAIRAVEEMIPVPNDIELLVISHTDADHLAAADEILEKYHVKKIVHTGYSRKYVYTNKDHSANYKRLLAAIKEEDDLVEINLYEKDSSLSHTTNLIIGNATINFLCGFGKPPESWKLKAPNLKLNSVSIVMRLEYGGNSVLFTGDGVGRYIGERSNALKATEKYLVEEVPEFLLNADVLIAPHHGADNGSSKRFIQATSPEYLIFSAGEYHNHPTKQAVNRYFRYCDIEEENIFRTDRGSGWLYTSDDEKRYKNKKIMMEWKGQAIENCEDEKGDDDILITLSNNGNIVVSYANPDPCAL